MLAFNFSNFFFNSLKLRRAKISKKKGISGTSLDNNSHLSKRNMFLAQDVKNHAITVET